MYIPRLNRMYCQRMYMTDESQSNTAPGQMLQQPYPGVQQPYPGMQMPGYPGVQQPYPGVQYPTNDTEM